MYLSHIFEWFAEDFAAHGGSARALVSKHLGTDVTGTGVEVRYLDYDWALNAKP